MNDIKFRAWDGHEMHQVRGIHFDAGVVDLKSDSVDLKDVELLQCTNYKDMDNHYIYEGDILADGLLCVFVNSIQKFFWMKYNDQTHLNFSHYKIIGNRYEHASVIISANGVRINTDKPPCPKICADPDLFRCVGNYGVSNVHETRKAQQREWRRIAECPYKNRYQCHREK